MLICHVCRSEVSNRANRKGVHMTVVCQSCGTRIQLSVDDARRAGLAGMMAHRASILDRVKQALTRLVGGKAEPPAVPSPPRKGNAARKRSYR